MRAYHHEFEVVQPFSAKSMISGAERTFKPGARIICDTEPGALTVMFETGGAFFLVERSVFEDCCRARKPTTMPV